MDCGDDGIGTAGGHCMQTAKDPGEVATVSPRGKGEATALHLTTTLYELMTALQAVVAAVTAFSGDSTDTIYGLGGNDLLCGNAGNDTLVGGSGDDTLVGDAGTDVCDGGSHIGGDTASGCESVTAVP
jgi:Ca2+-binding RTX toxin-like protein